MGVLQTIRNRAKAGFPLLRRGAEALLAKGSYTPAVTATNAAGQTVIMSPERVEPKGVLRSTTVLFCLGTAITTGSMIYEQLRAGQAPAEELWVALLGSLGGIWRHVRSWMPTRGAPAPKPS